MRSVPTGLIKLNIKTNRKKEAAVHFELFLLVSVLGL